MKKPFEPIFLPLPEDLINYGEIIGDIALASSKLGTFSQRIFDKTNYSQHALRHLMKLESIYSTKIEGTQTTIDAVYEAELEKDKQQSDDIIEVVRYGEALRVGASEVENDNPLTNRLIKHLHKVMLSGDVRKNSRFQAGEFREQQNRVGDHLPPPAANVPELMGNLELYINDYYNDKLPPLVRTALIHAQFETIHPFPDGNGRVGRVIIPLYMYKQGLIRSPFFFISQELEKNKIKYYSTLQGTRTLTEKGFTVWIRFFLQSVINQIDQDLTFIDAIEELNGRLTHSLKSHINTNNIEHVVNAVFQMPIFTCDTLHEETGISKSTLRNYIRIMEGEGLVYASQQKRNKRYYFAELLDLIR